MRHLWKTVTMLFFVLGLYLPSLFAQTDCNTPTPYTQDFEGVADYSLPDCWSQVNPFEGGYPAVESYQPHEGSKALRFRTYQMPQLAVMPTFTQPLNTLQISFWTRRENTLSGTFSVGYVTDINNAGSFVPVWSRTATQMSNNNYQFFTVSFEDVAVDPSLNYHIAFRYEASSAFVFWYVDDITVSAVPLCNPPFNLTASAVTSTTATLSWNGNADNYLIYYKSTLDTLWNEIFYVSLDSAGYLLEGLSPVTTYQWYVVAECEDMYVQSATTATFTTECGVYPVPYAESFNSTNNLPPCWNRFTGSAANAFAGTNPTATTGGWNFYTTAVFGQYHPRLNIYGSSIRRWIVTPAIDLSSTAAPSLTFKLAYTLNNSTTAITPGNQPTHRFMVLVSTDMGLTWSESNATVWSNDGNGDFVLDSVPATGLTVTLPLSNYIGDTIMIAFYGEANGGGGDNDLHIDDIEVEETSSCPKPISLDVLSTTNQTVTLDWTETGEATSWNILYGPTGLPMDHTDMTTLSADSHPYTVTDLTFGTVYDFYVQADCSVEQSGWTSPVSVCPGFVNMRVNGSDTLITCEAMVYDNGGPNGNYSNSCNSTLVIYPNMVGSSISVQGQASTEQGFDTLWVYDGVGIENTVLGVFTGLNQTVPLIVSSSGPLTLRFKSDMVNVSTGFALEVNCVTCFPPAGLTVSEITDNAAVLSWDNSENVTSWIVEYKAAEDTEWYQETVTDTMFTLSSLTEGTYYDIHVSADCNSEYSSPSILTFATGLNPTLLPYTTGFEENDERVWKLNNGDCDNRWMIGGVNNNGKLFITNNGTTAGYATDNASSTVSAEKVFAVGTGESFEISFDVQVGGESNYDYLKVFFAPETSEFPAENNFPAYAMVSYDTFAIDFSAYTDPTVSPYILRLTQGNTIHVEVTMPNPNPTPTDSSLAKLVFVWRNDNTDGTQPAAVIDNIIVDVVTCAQPDNFTISNVSVNSAEIMWSSSSTLSLWNVQYRETGTETWNTVSVSDTVCTLTGLTPGTSYEVRVQADCGSSQSLWVTGNFTTDCEIVTTFPYTQGFETTNQMPECWRQERVTGSVDWTTHSGDNTSTTSAHSGMLNAFLFHNSYDTAVTRLISPVFDLSGIAEPYVSFWVLQQPWTNDQDLLTVYYRTGADSDWQLLIDHASAIEEWFQDSIVLPVSYSFCQFAFEGRVNYGHGIALDDFTIGEVVVTLADPTVVTTAASNLAATSARLNGMVINPDNVAITAMGFEWKATQGGTYQPVAGTLSGNNLTADLNDLTANTEYTFRAFITFNGNTDYGDEMTFTTIPGGVEPNPCDVPTSLHATDIQNESITIAWDANAGVAGWNIRYRAANAIPWTTATSATNSLTVTPLIGHTDYEFQVQADCGDGNLSDWSGSVIVQTSNVGLENWLESNLTLFPNPTKEVVNVQWTMDNVQFGNVELQLVDAYGRLLDVVGANNYSPLQTAQINLSRYATGIYFVKAVVDGKTVAVRKVVRN